MQKEKKLCNYYQLRSIALWDFERGCEPSTDIEKLIKN